MSHTARNAYIQVADEFGVPEFIVRDLCGPIGKQTGIAFEERLALLRAKMETAAFIPVRSKYPDASAGRGGESDECQELRTCVLCEVFLDDDDNGAPVVDGEGELESGLLCRNCADARSRL